jgi:hypothetical protein
MLPHVVINSYEALPKLFVNLCPSPTKEDVGVH